MHKFDSTLKVREGEGAIMTDFRSDSDLNNCLSYDSQDTLRAEDNLIKIGARGDTRNIRVASKSSERSDDLHGDEDILDVAVGVLFHTGGASSDPTTKGGELQ
jgi:hypothetical protein